MLDISLPDRKKNERIRSNSKLSTLPSQTSLLSGNKYIKFWILIPSDGVLVGEKKLWNRDLFNTIYPIMWHVLTQCLCFIQTSWITYMTSAYGDSRCWITYATVALIHLGYRKAWVQSLAEGLGRGKKFKLSRCKLTQFSSSWKSNVQINNLKALKLMLYWGFKL